MRELIGVDRPLLLDADGLYALGDKLELLAERSTADGASRRTRASWAA